MSNVCVACGRYHSGTSCTLCTLPQSPEKLRAKQRKWRKKNRGHVLERDRLYRAKQSEGRATARAAAIRDWADANRDKMRGYQRAYRNRNLEKCREASRRCEAAKRARKAMDEVSRAAPKKPSAVAEKLLARAAEAATIAMANAEYKITRIGYQERR